MMEPWSSAINSAGNAIDRVCFCQIAIKAHSRLSPVAHPKPHPKNHMRALREARLCFGLNGIRTLESVGSNDIDLFAPRNFDLKERRPWSAMSPETTIQKARKAPPATSVHHIVPCSCSTRSSIAIRPIGTQVTANRVDQRSAQFKQPSSTSTVSLSTVRRGGLSTSTKKSDAKQEQSFNPQPTARKSLFCAQVVLRIATIRTRWDLSSTNVKSIVAEEESVTVATIRFDYDYEHRPPRRTEHEHDEIRC